MRALEPEVFDAVWGAVRALLPAASAVSTNVCRFELARDRCNHRPNESNRRARRLLDTALAGSIRWAVTAPGSVTRCAFGAS